MAHKYTKRTPEYLQALRAQEKEAELDAEHRHNRALIADKKNGFPDIDAGERLHRQKVWAARKWKYGNKRR